MKRLLILCAGLTSLLALATVQADTPLGAATTGVNHVFLGEEQHTSFTIKDYGPDSLDRGNFDYHNFATGVSYNIDVACVAVSGDVARFAFVVPAEEGPPGAGTARIVEVVDNGEPSAGPTPDTYADTAHTAPGPNITTACDFLNTLPFPFFPNNQQITAGNIQVR
jgi:hypothetical protein